MKTAHITPDKDAIASEAAILSSAVRKVQWRVLPILSVIALLNYIDRVNISFVRGYLASDVGIGVAAYGLGAGIFFLSYLVFQVPANIALTRFGGRVWLSSIATAWGVVSMLMATRRRRG